MTAKDVYLRFREKHDPELFQAFKAEGATPKEVQATVGWDFAERYYEWLNKESRA